VVASVDEFERRGGIGNVVVVAVVVVVSGGGGGDVPNVVNAIPSRNSPASDVAIGGNSDDDEKC